MSTVEPAGTWQYAHSVCLPGGRPVRVEQRRLGDEHERRLRVLAAGHRRLGRGDLGQRAADVHGAGTGDGRVGPRHRLGQRVVELEHARPVAEARPSAPGAGPGSGRRPWRRAGAARRRRARPSTSAARARSSTRWSHTTSPPCWPRIATSASVIACEPPSAHGQPTRWASAAEHEADAGRQRPVERQDRVRGEPGEQRRAPRSLSKRRRAERSPPGAGRRARSGRGAAGGGAATAAPCRSSTTGRPPSVSGAISRRHAAPSAPRPATVSSSERCSSAAPPSSGWASGIVGWRQRTPCSLERQVAQRRPRRCRAGGSPSRRRGGSRARSARPCGSRRPASAPASNTTTRRPASGHRDRGDEAVGAGADDDGVVLAWPGHGAEPYRATRSRPVPSGHMVLRRLVSCWRVSLALRRGLQRRRRLGRPDGDRPRRRRRRPRRRRPTTHDDHDDARRRPRRRPPPPTTTATTAGRRPRRSCRSSRPRPTPSTTCARASSSPPTRPTPRCPSPA